MTSSWTYWFGCRRMSPARSRRTSPLLLQTFGSGITAGWVKSMRGPAGNGRLSRLLAAVMALQAGWPHLDFTAWDENSADYFNAIQAGLSDYEPMKEMVRQALRGASGTPDA